MIRHIVLIRFDPATTATEVAAILADLRALRDAATGMLGFQGGPNTSPEGLAQGYTHAFTVDFTDAAARDGYLAHPAHLAAGGRLVAATRGGTEGLAVLDLEVEDG